MEPDQTTADIVNFPLQCEEWLELCVHFDLTNWEKVFFLDSVALHMSLDNRSSIIVLLLCVQSEEALSVKHLEELHSSSTGKDHLYQFTPTIDCSPAALYAQNSVRYAFLKKSHSEGHLELKDSETFHYFEAQ